MKRTIARFRKWEFENRIFISLGIAAGVYLLCATFFHGRPSLSVIAGRAWGASPDASIRISFILLGAQMILASLLRMWAGSLLTSGCVMSFAVKTERFVSSGPYLLTRNPIYFADFWALSGLAVCLPPAGLLIPILFFFHYRQLILYEETSLAARSHRAYDAYLQGTPRLFPTLRSALRFARQGRPVRITRDGFRHNALYLLFAPGFAVAAATGDFLWALVIGLPAVIDWAVVHTKIGRKRKDPPPPEAPAPVKKVFRDVLYSQCWEDPQTDRNALRIAPREVLFSITSGGCNVLAFLIDDPAKVYALDLNPHQTHLLELKMRAFASLDYGAMLEFLGVRPSGRRRGIYLRLRPELSDCARAFWDARLKMIERGIIHCGRYEWYMKLIRRGVRFCVGGKLIDRFFLLDDAAERERLFAESWNTLRWKFCTRILLSRRVMTLLFDRAFFDQLESDFSFGAHFAEKAKHALTRLPVKENPYLSYILLGRFTCEEQLPLYLRREHFQTIRSRLDRIELVTGDCTAWFRTLPADSIDKFNFSNIFEWMPGSSFESLLRETLRVASSRAVIVYRNLLVPRSRPAALASRLLPRNGLAELLLSADRSFIYDRYVIEQVRKESATCNTPSLRLQHAVS